ncbi:MAG: glycosyltransferase [Gemmatimonadetes bacterium]|nr:glycosyltransferase [Gemmatimonadota bacterium]
MVLLHVLAPGDIGGLERVVQALAIGMQERGMEVHVAAILDRPGDHFMFGALRDAGVAVHPIPLPPRAYRTERASIGALCRRIRPDIVHTHGYRADVVDAPAARRIGIPTVTTLHGFTGGSWKNRAYLLLQRMSLRRFDLVVAVARAQLRELAHAGIPAARVRVVPNAWWPDDDPFDRETARRRLGIPPGSFHLGWVGRLSWEKAPEVFLDAAARLRPLPLRISVIGDGPERATLEERARQLRLQSRVVWWGTLARASRFFPAFDAFVLSSRTEGTPIVLFEAMRAAVPIVATAVGGVPDMVSPQEALLVPPDDPAALAGAIESVHHDPTTAAARASRAAERLRHYDAREWIERYAALYEAVRRPHRADRLMQDAV